MNITIRKCMISDATFIRELCKDHLGYDYPMDKFEENLRKLMAAPNHLLLVAENNNQLLGFAHASDMYVIYGPPMKLLSAIVVDEKYRGYGVAHELVSAVEKWAKDSGVAGIRLYSGAERSDANAFYKHAGYEFVKAEMQFIKIFEK